jgi:sec-independent protein translocase protein TatA
MPTTDLPTTTLAIFGLPTGAEWFIILAIGLLLFGRRLPEVGRSLGQGIVEFKKGLKGVEEEINDESDRDQRRDRDRDRDYDDRPRRQVEEGRGYERLPRDERGGAAANVRVSRDEPATTPDPYRDQAR